MIFLLQVINLLRFFPRVAAANANQSTNTVTYPGPNTSKDEIQSTDIVVLDTLTVICVSKWNYNLHKNKTRSIMCHLKLIFW